MHSIRKKRDLDPIIKILQNKQVMFENEVERFPTCDVKIQELLKFIRKDKELWQSIEDKLEIRVIKIEDEGKEIVFHDEKTSKEIWSGKYHMYLTVHHAGERFVIDPYIGGSNACAHTNEPSFINTHWRGKEGKDYILDTIAPVHESYNDDVYTPAFSVQDYMDNFFDPYTYKSHMFYYDL